MIVEAIAGRRSLPYRVVLFHANRRPEDAPFADDFRDIAGPPGMVQSTRAAVVASGVDEDDIRTEEFTGY
jgi:ferredoxin-NADP reductase